MSHQHKAVRCFKRQQRFK